MSASKIMVIRHAEKPDDAGTVLGINVDGHQDPEALIVRRWQRAGALATFFAPPDAHFRDQRIEKPLTIFASRVAPHSKSLRPQHTVGPLVELIGQGRLRLDFSEGKEQQLVAAALAMDGVVLISWHHEAIPAIKDLLLGDHSAPRKWDKERSDLVTLATLSFRAGIFSVMPLISLPVRSSCGTGQDEPQQSPTMAYSSSASSTFGATSKNSAAPGAGWRSGYGFVGRG